MHNPIDIRILSGVRLDVYPNATIEINMGGISLLNLQDRAGTYTNSFKLPRTSTNEAVFGFASYPTRNNHPIVDVIITKGLFQRSASLKVLEFGNDYNCSVSYINGTIIENIKNKTIKDLLNNYILAEQTSIQSFIQDYSEMGLGSGFFNLHNTPVGTFANIPSTSALLPKSLTIKLTKFFEILQMIGISITGTLLSTTDFSNTYITLYDALIIKDFDIVIESISYYHFSVKTESQTIVSDIIKEIASFFFADVKYVDNGFVLNTIDFTISSIPISGAIFTKKIYSGLKKTNRINYDVSKFIENRNTIGDAFTADGIEDAEIVKLKSYLPVGDGINFDLVREADNLSKKFSMCTFVNDGSKELHFDGEAKTIFNSKRMAFFNLSGFYSSKLNPIFATPVILDASQYLDLITADNIMNNRIINSVQLGGKYWVDSMAYNLTTGQSKLTLIKLP